MCVLFNPLTSTVDVWTCNQTPAAKGLSYPAHMWTSYIVSPVYHESHTALSRIGTCASRNILVVSFSSINKWLNEK